MSNLANSEQPDSGDAFDPSPYLPHDAEPNTRPGPTDQGGHGGMATREQEAKLQEVADPDSDTSKDR